MGNWKIKKKILKYNVFPQISRIIYKVVKKLINITIIEFSKKNQKRSNLFQRDDSPQHPKNKVWLVLMREQKIWQK